MSSTPIQNQSIDNTQRQSVPIFIERDEPLIQVTAEIPQFMNGSGFGLEIGHGGDHRITEIINSTIGTTQEAIDNVSLKGRFRVQERNINIGNNISHEDVLYSSSDQHNGAVAGGTVYSNQIIDLTQNNDQYPGQDYQQDHRDQSGELSHHSHPHSSNYSPLNFEIKGENERISLRPPTQILLQQENIENPSHIQGNSVGSKKEYHRSNSKSKSYSGYFQIREKLNESSAGDNSKEQKSAAEDQEIIPVRALRRLESTKKNLRNRIESDDNLADKEDNVEQKKANLSKYQSTKSNKSKNSSIQDKEEAKEEDQEQEENEKEENADQVQPLTKQESEQYNAANSPQIRMKLENIVQEDHENEADESSCGDRKGDHENNRSRELHKSRSFSQKGVQEVEEEDEDEEEEEQDSTKQKKIKDDSYFYQEQQNPQQIRVIVNGKEQYKDKNNEPIYPSEMRSDESQRDNESPNEYQSITSLQNKLIKHSHNDRTGNVKVKSRELATKPPKRDLDVHSYAYNHPDMRASNVNMNLGHIQELLIHDAQNNSQDFAMKRYDWGRGGEMMNKLSIGVGIKNSDDTQELTSQNQVKSDDKDTFTKEIGQTSTQNQYTQQYKMRQDSDVNDFNFNNATMGQMSGNLENEDIQISQTLNIDQVRMSKLNQDKNMFLLNVNDKTNLQNEDDQNSGLQINLESQQITVTPTDRIQKHANNHQIMIIDKEGKKNKFHKQNLKISQYKSKLLVRLPSGRKILASVTDLNTIQSPHPYAQVLMTDEVIAENDFDEDFDSSDDKLGKNDQKFRRSAKTHKHSDAQRGESLTSLKKIDRSSTKGDDCEQKGRFLIKNRIEDGSNSHTRSKKRASKSKAINEIQTNKRKQTLITGSDEISPQRAFYNQQMMPPSNQQLMIMGQFLAPHTQQSIMPYQQIYQSGQSPLTNRGSKYEAKGFLKNSHSLIGGQARNPNYEEKTEEETDQTRIHNMKRQESIKKQFKELQSNEEEEEEDKMEQFETQTLKSSQKQAQSKKPSPTKSAKEGQGTHQHKKQKKRQPQGQTLESIQSHLNNTLGKEFQAQYNNPFQQNFQYPPQFMSYQQPQQQQLNPYFALANQQLVPNGQQFQYGVGQCPYQASQAQLQSQMIDLCKQQTLMFGQVTSQYTNLIQQILTQNQHHSSHSDESIDSRSGSSQNSSDELSYSNSSFQQQHEFQSLEKQHTTNRMESTRQFQYDDGDEQKSQMSHTNNTFSKTKTTLNGKTTTQKSKNKRDDAIKQLSRQVEYLTDKLKRQRPGKKPHKKRD